MGLLDRIFRRASGDAPRRADPDHAPDMTPEEVPWPGQKGFDGHRIEGLRGPLIGLEGGNAGGPTIPYVPGEPR